jgi:hypothetical protein
MAFRQIWALGQGTHARPMAAKRAPAQEVPSISAMRSSLIVANCLTRSAAMAGLSLKTSSSSGSPLSASLSLCSHSSRASWVRISSAEKRRRTSETNRGSSWRKLDDTSDACEIHQFLTDHIVERRLEPNALSDGPRRFAFLDPHLMVFARTHRWFSLQSGCANVG